MESSVTLFACSAFFALRSVGWSLRWLCMAGTSEQRQRTELPTVHEPKGAQMSQLTMNQPAERVR